MSKFKAGDKVRAVRDYPRGYEGGVSLTKGHVYTVDRVVSAYPGVYLREYSDAGWMEDDFFEFDSTIWDDLKSVLAPEEYDRLAKKHDGPPRKQDTWTITVEIDRTDKGRAGNVKMGVTYALKDSVLRTAVVTNIEATEREVAP